MLLRGLTEEEKLGKISRKRRKREKNIHPSATVCPKGTDGPGDGRRLEETNSVAAHKQVTGVLLESGTRETKPGTRGSIAYEH